MNGRYLLDTNIVIALFADEFAVRNRVKDISEIFIPSIVIGELYYGAFKSMRAKENIARIDNLALSSVILICNLETARWYGKIKSRLKQKGIPIPENDIWISASSFQHDLTLITNDVHFNQVEGLRIENL